MNKGPIRPITLRHPEVYRMDEWHELCAETRANLILVAEGLRPATAVDFETNESSLLTVLDALNLYSCFEEPYYWFISGTIKERQEFMSPWFQAHPHLEQSRMLGELIGYPTCCINDFIEHNKNGSNNSFRKLIEPKDVPVTIPNEFAFISHVPCSLDCNASLEQGKKNQTLIKAIDPYTHDMAMLEGILRWGKIINQDTVREIVGKYGRDKVQKETYPPIWEPTDEVLREKYQV